LTEAHDEEEHHHLRPYHKNRRTKREKLIRKRTGMSMGSGARVEFDGAHDEEHHHLRPDPCQYQHNDKKSTISCRHAVPAQSKKTKKNALVSKSSPGKMFAGRQNPYLLLGVLL